MIKFFQKKKIKDNLEDEDDVDDNALKGKD